MSRIASIKRRSLGCCRRTGKGGGAQASRRAHAHAAMDMELEHGGNEDDRGSESSSSSSKRSFGASSDATVSSTPSKLQALRFAEDLSLPSVQVVVMSANMGCSHCRQRVADVVSKMNGERLHAEFFHHQDKSFHLVSSCLCSAARVRPFHQQGCWTTWWTSGRRR
ncbi:uncharacterized protein [Zea mays]|uniref:uncharacterized protein isoform X2 n=1 Tax=Zea mays TaxID=4577 RepID=UPI0009AA9B9B|nr:uncharacterized protein LOC100276232 isoform X2 [Zea mays]